jgi:hypothetical protein
MKYRGEQELWRYNPCRPRPEHSKIWTNIAPWGILSSRILISGFKGRDKPWIRVPLI